MSERPQNPSRRQVLVTIGRTGILAGVVGGLGLLVRSGNGCPLSNPCASCGRLRACNLDKAEEFRQSQREKQNG